MPFKTLKIDRSFLVDVATNEQKKNMLDSIINMGHKLNYTIVAEGIETLDQIETCKKYNCDFAQGYLYSRPLPFDQLILYLNR